MENKVHWTSVPGKTGTQSTIVPLLTSLVHLQKVVHWTSIPAIFGKMY